MLTTSRRALPGQVSHQPLELHRLAPEDALDAFRDYAPQPDAWGEWQSEDLRAVMAFLDGYPFPIRLAASYMERAPCGLAELRRELEANPRGTLRYRGDEEDRATSLAATLDLSYNALPADAREILPLLALFPAGLSRDAVRAILGEAGESALETLRLHGMAEWRDEAGDGRFALPEPARRYAEALQPADALERHAPAALAFFHRLIDAANDLIVNGNILEGRLLLTLEQPNLRRFLDWGYDHEQRDDGVSLSARATASLGNYWTLITARARDEVLQRLQRALGAARRAAPSAGEANVLQAIGDVQQFRKETTAALESYAQALSLFRAVGDRLGEANVLAAQSRLTIDEDPARSQALLEQAVKQHQLIGDVYGAGVDLYNYGLQLLRRGRNTEALPHLLRARDLFTSRGLIDDVGDTDNLISRAQGAPHEQL
ncbi:MAG TPA: hypothetical protein VF897_25055 [Roseiflexaceae bacterium]